MGLFDEQPVKPSRKGEGTKPASQVPQQPSAHAAESVPTAKLAAQQASKLIRQHEHPAQPRGGEIACSCLDEPAHGHHHHVHLDKHTAVARVAWGGAFVLAGWLLMWENFAWFNPPAANILAWGAILLCGAPIVISAIRGLAEGRLNLNELVATAIIGAIVIYDSTTHPLSFLEAGTVAVIMQLGFMIELLAESSSRQALHELEKLAPEQALVSRDGREIHIPSQEVREGDELILKPGDRIAADGEIISGTSNVDESMLTGESLPVRKETGHEVYAGTINLTGTLRVRVTKAGEAATLGRIIDLVRRAETFQPKIIRLVDRFFALYSPAVVLLAVVTYFVTGDPVRAVTILVVGCPCPLLLSSPTATVAGMGRAGREHIMVKAGPSIEASAALDTVVFDKTGTLTTGDFQVARIETINGFDEKTLLQWAAAAELRSNHPLAKALLAEARTHGIEPTEPTHFENLAGRGVRARFDGKDVIVGSRRAGAEIIGEIPARETAFMRDVSADAGRIPVYVFIDGKLAGAVLMQDTVRPHAAEAIQMLRYMGINHICLLSGDRAATAELIGQQTGCDEVRAELLPNEKVEYIRQLQRQGKRVAMVGDGINDAPSLVAADLGISMGIRGTDVAIHSADAILLKDDLRHVPLLIAIARTTRRAIFQNLLATALINAAALTGATLGYLGIIAAAALHNGGMLFPVFNAIRLVRFRHRPTAQPTRPFFAEQTPAASTAAT